MLHSFKKGGFAALGLAFGLAFAALPVGTAPVVAQQILPLGLTQFTDANGAPLAAGSVYFYIPNTLTAKTTWSDAALSVVNTNPVALDAAGRAPIWGKGSYRQIVKDVNGNQIWDRTTSATDWGNVAITGGTISGVSLSGNIVSSMSVFSFTTAGATQYFTVPTGVVKVKITGTGGGGGGGVGSGTVNLGGAGGGAGGTAIKIVSNLVSGQTLAIVVGAGGASATAGTATTVVTPATANPGNTTITAGGGGAGDNATGGAGGTATNGDLNLPGGGGGAALGSNSVSIPGAGGNSYWGAGARAGNSGVYAGGNYGGGGSNTGTGGNGVVVVEY